MPRKPSMKRPAALAVGPVKVRPVRGPRTDGTGRWYWRADLCREGKRRTIWTGWATSEEATREVADLVSRDALDAPRTPVRVDTVRDLLEYWTAAQEDRADLRPETVKGCRVRAGALTRSLGDVRLDRMDRGTLEGHRDRRMGIGIASRTVAGELKTLGAAWGWGREIGLTPDRSLPLVHVLIRDAREKVTPTPGEVAAVLGRLHGWQRLAVTLAFSTGARIGEVASLTWDRVDLEAGEIRLDGKTGSRVVPLPPHAVAALVAAPHRGTTVLGVSVGSARALLGLAIHKACKAAKVRPWTPHGLRRAACDALYRTGVEVGAAAALLGHSPAVALRYYRQATAADVRAAARKAKLGHLPAGTVVDLRSRRGA